MNLENISKYMCLILRHKPETIGITLDEHGWANVDELIDGIRKDNPGFDLGHLYEIVKTDSKGRYSFNEDKTLIRLERDRDSLVVVPFRKRKGGSAHEHNGSF